MKAKYGFNLTKTTKDYGVYYVYLYIDPRNNIPFYVGKGKNDRDTFHLRECKEYSSNLLKYNKIQKIVSLNMKPIIKRICTGLTENHAYELENLLIGMIGTLKNATGPLTNIMSGGQGNRRYENDSLSTYEKISIKSKLKWADPTSVYNSQEFRKKWSETKRGEGNGRYNDHRTWEEIHGKEKADVLKLECAIQRSGKGNSCAKEWVIVSDNNIITELHGNVKKFCTDNKLSMGILKKYLNSVVDLSESGRKYKLRGNLINNTLGWALYEKEFYYQTCR